MTHARLHQALLNLVVSCLRLDRTIGHWSTGAKRGTRRSGCASGLWTNTNFSGRLAIGEPIYSRTNPQKSKHRASNPVRPSKSFACSGQPLIPVLQAPSRPEPLLGVTYRRLFGFRPRHSLRSTTVKPDQALSASMSSRRTHLKSRNGCAQCKKRRIKVFSLPSLPPDYVQIC